jgi:hypothetical protein
MAYCDFIDDLQPSGPSKKESPEATKKTAPLSSLVSRRSKATRQLPTTWVWAGGRHEQTMDVSVLCYKVG